MSKDIGHHEVYPWIRTACERFSGNAGMSVCKNHILALLFIKYISDLRKDRLVKLEKDYQGQEERIERAMKRERFLLPGHCTYDYIYIRRNEPYIGDVINMALYEIEENNREKVAGVFRDIDFNSNILGDIQERNFRLKSLIKDFNNPLLHFRPSKDGKKIGIGSICDYLISVFAKHAGDNGSEFYTQPELSGLMARLMEPRPGERFYDPACGTGSLLIKLADQMEDRNFSAWGQECDAAAWALCKMNMFMHDIDHSQIEMGDTLKNPKLTVSGRLMKFDVVAANPPCSRKKWGSKQAENDPYNRFWRGIPPKNRGEFAFITHMIESLKENGRMVIAVPHGVLIRGGSEAKIREHLIRENLLDAVIGLPAQWSPGTKVSGALMIFRKNRNRSNIIFIDAGNHSAHLQTSASGVSGIEGILNTYRSFKSINGYSQVTSPEEIKENSYNLNIPRYVNSYNDKKPKGFIKLKDEIKELEAELSTIRSKIDGYLKDLDEK